MDPKELYEQRGGESSFLPPQSQQQMMTSYFSNNSSERASSYRRAAKYNNLPGQQGKQSRAASMGLRKILNEKR